ncbi:MAG: hypothetical protein Q9217_004591 [Psora testacea]
MPKTTKRKSTAPKSTSTASSNALPPTDRDIPSPFTKAPSDLESFLSNLPEDHIYLISLDKHDRAFKRRLFTVPLLLNIFLTILVIYRIKVALPTYLGIFLSVLGYETPQKVDVKNNAVQALVGIGAERTLMFLGDFILLRFVGMWPVDFFLGRGIFGKDGEASPVAWRRSVSFRDCEIIVRRSRRWDDSIFYKENLTGTGTINTVEEFLQQGKESKAFQERILPAVDWKWVTQKTGYQMLDKSWDLYFAGMIEAHALVDDGVNKLEDFQTSVLVNTERWGWLSWEVWKDHEKGNEMESPKKLQAIKDGLTGMGNENLFFRSIEIIQNETSRPGSFTAEKRQKAILKMKEEFDEQGVNFDDFWAKVGGIESMPGLEVST